jgi:hypothetical protein
VPLSFRHVDTLTTKSALPLLEFTNTRADASRRILDEVQTQVEILKTSYQTLQREVVERYEAADQVKLVAERLNQTIRLARGVSRCLLLSRQLDAQMHEYSGGGIKKSDFRAMARAAHTLATLRALLLPKTYGQEGYGLDRINVIKSVASEIVLPTERLLTTRAQQIVREFSMSTLLSRTSISQQPTGAAPTFTQNEETKARVISALIVLYSLSPVKTSSRLSTFEPSLALSALQEYLQTALKSSLAALSRSLATLPTLDKTLLELAARCQNIVALEYLLSTIVPPVHPAFAVILGDGDDHVAEASGSSEEPRNLLQALLSTLDTSSLPSFFWRSLASALAPRVQEILSKGGVSARTLRANRDSVKDSIRRCVDRGSQVPEAVVGGGKGRRSVVNLDREATVMVAAVIGPLGR